MADEVIEVEEPLPDEAEPTPDPDEDEAAEEEAEEAEPEAEPEGDSEEEDESEEEKPEDKPKRRKPSRRDRKVARLEARVEELLAKVDQPKADPIDAPKPPKPEDFDNYDDYQRALVRHEARQIVAEERKVAEAEEQNRRKEQHDRTVAQRRDAFYENGAEEFPDFEEVFHPDVPVSEAMARALIESDVGPKVAYYLGEHEDEAARIAKLNPIAAAREIGKLEAKLTTPIPKRTTSAPSPVKTVGSTAKGDKNPEKMSYSEYRAARESGKIK